jgi:hypothetical protein
MARKYSLKDYIDFAIIFIIIATPLVVLSLPRNYFDNGDSICLSRVLLDIECYACGMTRAMQHLIHLDYLSAIEYNPLSLAVLPVICYIGIMELFKAVKRIKLRSIGQ